MDQLAHPVGANREEHPRLAEQTLQRVLTGRPPELRGLYWRAARLEGEGTGAFAAELQADGEISLLPGTTLVFDTYFGAFFEAHWRLNTRLQTLRLSVTVRGTCVVRLLRRAIGVNMLVAETRVATTGHAQTVTFSVPDRSSNFREYGLLYFEVTASTTGSGAELIEAAWLGEAASEPVSLGIVFCTFNRESFMAAVLEVMVEDPVVLAGLDRVFIVNQGRPGLRAHASIAPFAERLGSRLTIIEQGNFGGAGGFTRGMLATLDDPDLTHCAFLDDDIRLEPDTIPRLTAFLSLAKENVAVGGQMLDSVQPTRLYEAGAVIDTHNWFPRAVLHNTDLQSADGLNSIAQPQSVHFNGWWCFAVSLDIVRKVGLPLPCFIRGDDAEYGMRLYRQGVFTTVLPGAAVWHEPFYLKLGNWQLYYETRNLLVLAALHDRFSARAALRRAGRSWLLHLLTFRYFGAALIMRGIADFLAGPDVLEQDPQVIHAGIMALRQRYGGKSVQRRQVVDAAVVARIPRGRPAFLFWFAFVLLRNALVPTSKAQPVLVQTAEFSWIGLRHAEHIVLDNWWEPEMSAYRRDRSVFWELAIRTLPLLLRLQSRGNHVAAAWKAAAPRLTSAGFWRRYLGCETADIPAPPPR